MLNLEKRYRVHSKQCVVQGALEFGQFQLKTGLVQLCLLSKIEFSADIKLQ